MKLFTFTITKVILSLATTCYILLLLYLAVSFIYYNLSSIDYFYLFLLALLPCLLISYGISNILLTIGVNHKKFLFISVLVLHFIIGFILFYALANDALILFGIIFYYIKFLLPILVFIICVVVVAKEGKNKNKNNLKDKN